MMERGTWKMMGWGSWPPSAFCVMSARMELCRITKHAQRRVRGEDGAVEDN
jgi:hypothetical protein